MTKVLSQNDEIERVHAYHEAGHAVVAWSLAISLGEVKIDLNGGLCNHALIVSPSLDPELMSNGDWTKVQKRALVLLAGEVAERVCGEMAEQEGDAEMADLFRDACKISFESVESGSDREELREMVELVFGSLGPKSIEWIAKAEESTKNIVINNWEKIRSLADALIATKVLSGSDTTQIIQNS